MELTNSAVLVRDYLARFVSHRSHNFLFFSFQFISCILFPAVFQRYNNPSEEDIEEEEVVLAPSLSFLYKNPTTSFPHGAPMIGKPTEAVA